MRILGHIFFLAALMISSSLPVAAQELLREHAVPVYFYQGKTDFDPAYAGNGERLQALREQFGRVVVEKVVVSAGTSPEGASTVNGRVARERAGRVAAYAVEQLGADPSTLSIEVQPDSWIRLETLVEASDWNQKDSALVLIRRHHDDKAIAGASRRIRNYLYVCFYPELRSATIVYRCPETAEVSVDEDPGPVAGKTGPAPAVAAETVGAVPTDPPALSSAGHGYLKTNLAAWPILVPNLAVEFEIGSHLSVSVPLYYSATDWFSDGWKFRVFGSQPEFRWWFRSGEFLGPFAALHATFGWYNMAFGGDYRYQDHRRGSPTLGGGMDLGWKVPLSRRWGLEFALGAGYLPLYSDVYYNVPDGRFVETRYRNYWGVDHAAVTLTWQFDY